MAAWPRRCCTVQQRSKIFEAEPAGRDGTITTTISDPVGALHSGRVMQMHQRYPPHYWFD